VLQVMLADLFNANIRETQEMLYEFEEPYIVDSSKFEKTFGKQATSYEEGIRQTVAWYRNHR
jgi:nucleoside-diphosphate-sugar epimerase